MEIGTKILSLAFQANVAIHVKVSNKNTPFLKKMESVQVRPEIFKVINIQSMLNFMYSFNDVTIPKKTTSYF